MLQTATMERRPSKTGHSQVFLLQTLLDFCLCPHVLLLLVLFHPPYPLPPSSCLTWAALPPTSVLHHPPSSQLLGSTPLSQPTSPSPTGCQREAEAAGGLSQPSLPAASILDTKHSQQDYEQGEEERPIIFEDVVFHSSSLVCLWDKINDCNSHWEQLQMPFLCTQINYTHSAKAQKGM